MARSFSKSTACRVILCFVGAAICGCARQPEEANQFAPPPELARAAVEAVLIDWQAGRPPEQIDRLPATVQVVDQQREKGQELDEFEILGEAPGSAPRCFAVRLKLRSPEADLKVRYVVVGINPLWVFRQEDFDMLSHWDHPMPGDGKRELPPEKTGSQASVDEEDLSTDRQDPTADRAPVSE
jgi:hypothetical protein